MMRMYNPFTKDSHWNPFKKRTCSAPSLAINTTPAIPLPPIQRCQSAVSCSIFSIKDINRNWQMMMMQEELSTQISTKLVKKSRKRPKTTRVTWNETVVCQSFSRSESLDSFTLLVQQVEKDYEDSLTSSCHEDHQDSLQEMNDEDLLKEFLPLHLQPYPLLDLEMHQEHIQENRQSRDPQEDKRQSRKRNSSPTSSLLPGIPTPIRSRSPVSIKDSNSIHTLLEQSSNLLEKCKPNISFLQLNDTYSLSDANTLCQGDDESIQEPCTKELQKSPLISLNKTDEKMNIKDGKNKKFIHIFRNLFSFKRIGKVLPIK